MRGVARAVAGALCAMLAVHAGAQDQGSASATVRPEAAPTAATAGAGDGAALFRPPAPRTVVPAPASAPWTDATGSDHRQRDAQRRALEPVAPFVAPRPDLTEPIAPVPRSALEPADADAMRRQGERERDARRGRGGPLMPPVSTPPIQPDAPAAVAMPPPPRQVLPQPGQPGGPPIAVPTCGPAGCFDANGRAMPSAGGGMLMGPGGQPCMRMGASVTC